MSRWTSILAAMALLVSCAAAQSAGTQAQGAASGAAAENAASSSAALDAGTAVQATLTKPVDAKKAKPGDAVEAKVQSDVKSAGRVVVPKGSKLIGHVTQAKAREKGESESALGIAFDRAVLKNGQTIAFQGVIRGVAAAPQVSTSEADDMMASGEGPNYPSSAAGAGAGLAGAAGSTATGVANGVGNAAGTVAGNAGSMASTDAASTLGAAGANVGAASGGALGVNAAGIRGLPGLQIDAAASNSTNGTVIVSHNRNVHLDSGTQLMIQVITQ
jgi:hypothetical protein